MLNFIPTVGSLLAIIPPVLLAVIQLDSISLVLLVLTSLGVLQFLVGNVIEPLVLGDRLNLSPLVVLLSLIFWGWLWGVVGMLLSVPIMSAVKITLSRTPGGELWAQFMEDPRKTHDRPPSTDH
jgi:predicted PurR-regulated permease PerM